MSWLLKTSDCKSKFLLSRGALCLIFGDHVAGSIMQQSRITCRKPCACQAVQPPIRLSQHKRKQVAESGSAKMQPEPVYKAERALTDAGFRPKQAKGSVNFMGEVIEPLALESPVKVAERGSEKMQPEPVFEAEQALIDAGFRPHQARGLVRFVGDVIKPLGLESLVKVAETGSAKMQPEPVYRAERALANAGFTPQQAKGVIRFVGDVIKPLALKSSVLEVQDNLEDMDYTFWWSTIISCCIALETAVKLCSACLMSLRLVVGG